jgi:Cys-tRNA synthase (O-phospho-L-seryl-tRNA:Cys-tRNA synthase)
MQLRDKYGNKVNLAKWIKRVKDEELTVLQLKKAIISEVAEKEEEKLIELFQEIEKEGKKTIRFRPVKIDPYGLSPEQKEKLIKDLTNLIEALK